MHPLLITITFLTLIAAVTGVQIKHFVTDATKSTLFKNYEAICADVDEERAHSLLHERKCSDCKPEELREHFSKPKTKTRKVRVASLGVNTSRPPDNSRLNLWLLLHTQDEQLKEISARLIRNLYGTHPLFAKSPHLEYALLEALLVQKENTKSFLYPDDLATLHFSNSKIAEAFYFIMRGGVDLEGKIYPSFLYYITFNSHPKGQKKKINLLYASPELLESAINNPSITEKVLTVRERIWEIIENQEEKRKTLDIGEAFDRTTLKNLLKTSLEGVLESEHEKIFDFTLSCEGNFLIVYDPKTEILVREKVPVVFPASLQE